MRPFCTTCKSIRNEEVSMLLGLTGLGRAGIGILGVILWVALAFWPDRVARRKGHCFILFVAYVVSDRRI
jgi:hypothetical protein